MRICLEFVVVVCRDWSEVDFGESEKVDHALLAFCHAPSKLESMTTSLNVKYCLSWILRMYWGCTSCQTLDCKCLDSLVPSAHGRVHLSNFLLDYSICMVFGLCETYKRAATTVSAAGYRAITATF